MKIFAAAFVNGTMTLSADSRNDFWLEVSLLVGWIRFTKLRDEETFIPNGALFEVTELRSASESAPDPVASAQCVLWRRREAILAEQSISSYLLGLQNSEK